MAHSADSRVLASWLAGQDDAALSALLTQRVIFEPELQRCICVDIRFVLLMMDKFGGAGYLLDEMNLIR